MIFSLLSAQIRSIWRRWRCTWSNSRSASPPCPTPRQVSPPVCSKKAQFYAGRSSVRLVGAIRGCRSFAVLIPVLIADDCTVSNPVEAMMRSVGAIIANIEVRSSFGWLSSFAWPAAYCICLRAVCALSSCLRKLWPCSTTEPTALSPHFASHFVQDFHAKLAGKKMDHVFSTWNSFTRALGKLSIR
jgi:hypothetical protein